MSNHQLTAYEAENSVIEELVPDSKILILIFGGIKGAMGIPTFEFYQSSSILKENRVFFRDLSQSWYHAGLHGITKDLTETADYIQSVINRINPSETIFVGNSMGGYAAIMFSTLLNTGRVVAFSPQTFIDPINKLKLVDFRWLRATLDTYRRAFLKPKCYDLSVLLENSTRANQIDLHVSSRDALDMNHAHRISGYSNVNLQSYDIGGHNLVKRLRDNGTLKDILLKSVR